jgi:hypothetical protein
MKIYKSPVPCVILPFLAIIHYNTGGWEGQIDVLKAQLDGHMLFLTPAAWYNYKLMP